MLFWANTPARLFFPVIMLDFLKPAPESYQNLPADPFAEGLRQPGAVLLDVRRPDEFAQGHLPGAHNIDVTSPDFAQRMATLDSSQPTYVYCRSGARSAKAAAFLSTAGFGQVFNLTGGVLDWPHALVR